VQVLEGQGWRLAVDPSRRPFSVLVGGSGWAAELTVAEARALGEGVGRLLAQHRALVETLMAEEAIELELELELTSGEGALWLALEGDRQRWSLRFLLTPAAGGRGLEGSWPPEAAAVFAAALEPLVAAVDGEGVAPTSPFADSQAAEA
jgi:hypothetical protein